MFKTKSTWLTICYSTTKTKFLYRVPNRNSRFGIGCGAKTLFDFYTQGRCEVFKVKVMRMIYWLSLSLYAIFSEPQNSGETKGTTGDLPLVLSPLVWIPLQGIPAFRDFTIRDPLYFVIQFQALNSWIPLHFTILKKKIKKKKKILDFFLQNHEIWPQTESRNSGDHELWNHEMRGSPVLHI